MSQGFMDLRCTVQVRFPDVEFGVLAFGLPGLWRYVESCRHGLVSFKAYGAQVSGSVEEGWEFKRG